MLAVGKELLIGRTLNTNAHWVGKRLARMGTMLKQVTTIDDDLGEIALAFNAIAERSPDFLVVVGGLGPTPDDMTLRGLADAMGVGLRKNGQALRMIKEHYAERGMADIELTPSRVKMARLPEGSEPVPNRAGTAPGAKFFAGKTTVYCLPGVPREMKDIFKRTVEPDVKARLGKVHRKYVTMKLEGVFESTLAPVIEETLKRHPGAYLKSHPRGTREGVSRIELDIAVVGEAKREVDGEGLAIAEEMQKAAAHLGGTIRSVRETTT